MSQSIKRVWLDPFDPNRDADRVATWLRTSHVAQWWGDPDTQFKAVMERPLGGADALIIADEVAVGYLRWQRVTRGELKAAGLEEIPAGSLDIDIAIGEASYLGRGIGSRALRQLVARYESDASIPLIMLVASVENVRAIRAYEKADFRRIRIFNDPEYGQCWVLVFDRDAV